MEVAAAVETTNENVALVVFVINAVGQSAGALRLHNGGAESRNELLSSSRCFAPRAASGAHSMLSVRSIHLFVKLGERR